MTRDNITNKLYISRFLVRDLSHRHSQGNAIIHEQTVLPVLSQDRLYRHSFRKAGIVMYRLRTSLVLLTGVILFLVATFSIAQGKTQNLIQDGGFEQGASN